MALPDKFIIFLGRTFSGHNHDYLMLKQELPPAMDWFADINVRVDLGYLGIKTDYTCPELVCKVFLPCFSLVRMFSSDWKATGIPDVVTRPDRSTRCMVFHVANTETRCESI